MILLSFLCYEGRLCLLYPAVQGSGEAVWSRNRRGEFALYQR